MSSKNISTGVASTAIVVCVLLQVDDRATGPEMPPSIGVEVVKPRVDVSSVCCVMTVFIYNIRDFIY